MNDIRNIGVYLPSIFCVRSGFTHISLYQIPHVGKARDIIKSSQSNEVNPAKSKNRLKLSQVNKYTKVMVLIKSSQEKYGRILNNACI